MTNVRWSCDNSKLVSTGGADMSVMVWAYTGVESQDTSFPASVPQVRGRGEDCVGWARMLLVEFTNSVLRHFPNVRMYIHSFSVHTVGAHYQEHSYSETLHLVDKCV